MEAGVQVLEADLQVLKNEVGPYTKYMHMNYDICNIYMIYNRNIHLHTKTKLVLMPITSVVAATAA